MVPKIGQIVRRGPSTWLVRIYVGREPETRRRKYVGKFIRGGLRSAQAHLNRMLAERDLGRKVRSSRQTLGQYLDHWLDICARPSCEPRAFATTRAYWPGTSVRISARDRLGSCRRRKFRSSTAS